VIQFAVTLASLWLVISCRGSQELDGKLKPRPQTEARAPQSVIDQNVLKRDLLARLPADDNWMKLELMKVFPLDGQRGTIPIITPIMISSGSEGTVYITDAAGNQGDEAGNVEHRVGTYGKGYIELKRELISAWFDRSVAEIEQCSQCAYALVCGGGCAYLAAEEKGTYYASYCDCFQRNFQQTMVRTFVRLQHGQGLCEISVPASSGPVCM